MTKVMTAIQAVYGLVNGTISWSDVKHQSPALYQAMVRWTTESAYFQAWLIEIEESYHNRLDDEHADRTTDEDWSIWDYVNYMDQDAEDAYQEEVDAQIAREMQKTRRQRRVSKRLYKRRLLAQAKNRMGGNLLGDKLFSDDDVTFARHGWQTKYDSETRHFKLVPLSESKYQGDMLWKIESEMAQQRSDRWDMEDRLENIDKFNDRKNAMMDLKERVNDWLDGDLPNHVEPSVVPDTAKKQTAEIRQQIDRKQQRIKELNSLLMPASNRHEKLTYGSFNQELKREMENLRADIEKLRKYAA